MRPALARRTVSIARLPACSSWTTRFMSRAPAAVSIASACSGSNVRALVDDAHDPRELLLADDGERLTAAVLEERAAPLVDAAELELARRVVALHSRRPLAASRSASSGS